MYILQYALSPGKFPVGRHHKCSPSDSCLENEAVRPTILSQLVFQSSAHNINLTAVGLRLPLFFSRSSLPSPPSGHRCWEGECLQERTYLRPLFPQPTPQGGRERHVDVNSYTKI